MPSADIDGSPILILKSADALRILDILVEVDDVGYSDPLFQKLLRFKSELADLKLDAESTRLLEKLNEARLT